MYFIALATDYDGTIAHDGVVSETTLAALKRLKEISGMVPDLSETVPGCAFAPRCELAFKPCLADAPALAPVPGRAAHDVRCFATASSEAVS